MKPNTCLPQTDVWFEIWARTPVRFITPVKWSEHTFAICGEEVGDAITPVTNIEKHM